MTDEIMALVAEYSDKRLLAVVGDEPYESVNDALNRLRAAVEQAVISKDPSSFDSFKQLLSADNREDIEQFRDSYGFMLDMNKSLNVYNCGFHFELNDEDDGITELETLLEHFSPSAVYVGTAHMKSVLEGQGYSCVLSPWFEGGGFVLVLTVPASNPSR